MLSLMKQISFADVIFTATHRPFQTKKPQGSGEEDVPCFECHSLLTNGNATTDGDETKSNSTLINETEEKETPIITNTTTYIDNSTNVDSKPDPFVIAQYDNSTMDRDYMRFHSSISMIQPPKAEAQVAGDFPRPLSIFDYGIRTPEIQQIQDPFYKQKDVDSNGYLKPVHDENNEYSEDEENSNRLHDHIDSSNNIVYSPDVYNIPQKEKLSEADAMDENEKKRVFMLRLEVPKSIDLKSFDLVNNLTSSFNKISDSLRKTFLKRHRRGTGFEETVKHFRMNIEEIKHNNSFISVVFNMAEKDTKDDVLREIVMEYREAFKPLKMIMFAERYGPLNNAMIQYIICCLGLILFVFFMAWQTKPCIRCYRSRIPRIPLASIDT